MGTKPNTTLTAIPEAPGRWPLLGHTPALLRRRFGFTSGLRELGDVVKVYLGPMPTYVVTSPDLVYRLLVTEGNKFEKGVLFDRFRPFFGNGLAMSESTFHHRQRRLMQPAFHRQRIAHYTATMVKAANAISNSWQPWETVAVDKSMQELAVTIVGETLFSTEMGKSAIMEAQRSMPIVIKQGMIRALSPKFMEKLPVRGNREFDHAIERLHRIVHEVIVDARREGKDHGDLLSALLMVRDEDTGEGMDDAQIHDEVVTLLTGGIETTALALGWFFHEIAQNPEIETQFHEEVDRVIGGREVTFEDIPQLKYTQRIVDEVLRAYPIWLLMRRAREDVYLGQTHLEAGTEVVFSPHAMHHDPKYYPDPARFDPDRWIDGYKSTLPRGAYIPFGAGNRQCIGNMFARTEIVVAAATIASRWRLVPVPGKPVRIKVTGAAYPKELPMTAVPRND